MKSLKEGRTGASAHRRSKLAAALGAGLLVAALTACGGSGGKAAGSTDTLKMALPGWSPVNFDLPTNCTSPIFDFAYEPLIRISDDGGFAPGIAESWDYSEGNTIFTMKIRDGVKFADGTDLTVESVVDTLNYYKKTPGLNTEAYFSPLTIEAKGSDSVQVTSETPTRGMEDLFSTELCNNGLIISEAGLAEPEKMKTEMFGAGPYVYSPEESEPGDHYTYVPNEHYFDKTRQSWEKVELSVIGDPNTAFNALTTGQVQASLTGGAQLLSQAEEKGLDVDERVLWGAGIFVWDREGEISKPLADERVRQAVALAMDRDSLVSAATPGTKPQDQFASPALLGWDADLKSKYSYDVDRAKQLLDDAGYPDGFSVTLLSNHDDVEAQNVLVAAVEQLRQIGVEIEIKSSPESTFFTDITSKEHPLGFASWTFMGDMLYQSDRLYKLPYSAPLNPFESVDPDLEAAYEELQSSDDSGLEEAAMQFNEVMTEKAWYIPLTSSPLHVYSTGVEIGQSSPIGNYDYAGWTPKD